MARQFNHPLPWNQALKTALNQYGRDVLRTAALTDDHPRFICGGRTNGQAEFVMDFRGAQRHEHQSIERFLRHILADGQRQSVRVDVFGIDGQRCEFQLMRGDADNTCVFTAATPEPLTDNIIRGNPGIRQAIQLWGYLRQNLSVFVLTVGPQ